MINRKFRSLAAASAYFFLFAMTFSVADATRAHSAALTPELATQLSRNANQRVIVILKNPVTNAEAANDQDPLMDELRQVGAAQVKAFRMFNAVAATVSATEIARLKANPLVSAVIPDRVIHRAATPTNSAVATHALKTFGVNSPVPNVIPGLVATTARCNLSPRR